MATTTTFTSPPFTFMDQFYFKVFHERVTSDIPDFFWFEIRIYLVGGNINLKILWASIEFR